MNPNAPTVYPPELYHTNRLPMSLAVRHLCVFWKTANKPLPSLMLPPPDPPVAASTFPEAMPVIVHDVWVTEEWSVEHDLPAQPPLAVLDEDHVHSIAILLESHKPFSPSGFYPGIPDRTAVLPSEDIRLTYGGSMGNEFWVRTLNGDKLGFFRDDNLLVMLNDLDSTGGEYIRDLTGGEL